MAVEIANVIQAMLAFRNNGVLAPQLLAGAGVKAATFVRFAAGTYEIDLEQPLEQSLPVLPAQGSVSCAFSGNIATEVSDVTITVQLTVGAVPGVFDRLRIATKIAGVSADVPAAPTSIMVFRFPNVA